MGLFAVLRVLSKTDPDKLEKAVKLVEKAGEHSDKIIDIIERTDPEKIEKTLSMAAKAGDFLEEIDIEHWKDLLARAKKMSDMFAGGS